MGIKILYVEDEIFLGKIVFETLISRGFHVQMESDGNKVLNAFEKFVPDICVLDIMLPNKNGFELASEIRKKNQKVPIIFLTAKTQTDDVVKGFKLGANDYIRKPFSMEELIVRIESIFKLPAIDFFPRKDAILNIGKFIFDPNNQLLTISNETLKLSFRETELLQYLFLSNHSIIQRKDLMNHIWGNDSFFNSRNLDVYITKLRGYLKNDPSIQIITIKGVGYRFVIGGKQL
jgi:DNA-binding response OmpR family regulator